MSEQVRPSMRATLIAVAVHILIIALIPIQPLLVRATGTAVYLETEKMDPRALFRGHYAILGYRVAQDVVPAEMAQESRDSGKPVYVTVTTERPARFVAVSLERPDLQGGQACIVGRVRGFGSLMRPESGDQADGVESVDFPQIAQYFASPAEARRVEGTRGDDLLAKVATSSGCNAQLVGLEPRSAAAE